MIPVPERGRIRANHRVVNALPVNGQDARTGAFSSSPPADGSAGRNEGRRGDPPRDAEPGTDLKESRLNVNFTITILLEKKKTFAILLIVLAGINVGNLLAHVLLATRPSLLANTLEALFDLDREGNLSTLYNGLLLLGCGLLAGWIALCKRAEGGVASLHWAGISMILFFLFVDELCGLHDSLDFVLLERFNPSGVFSWPWVVVYGVFALVTMALLLPFFFSLATEFKLRFGIAAAVYLAGAIGMEMVAASDVSVSGGEGRLYPLFVAVEENLEMLALLIAGHGLVTYLEREWPGCRLTLMTEGPFPVPESPNAGGLSHHEKSRKPHGERPRPVAAREGDFSA